MTGLPQIRYNQNNSGKMQKIASLNFCTPDIFLILIIC
ncbi:Uncharacterized protein dnm_011150 [Desulfonema magnum]|uniref:Uncharacterized protein n=1 Tax=Desulfonema magnum TaxID=45655 RepID=A0A975BGQ4_9BACT|nr:Uncharacterized protein dnm_011150 [Desulfonema magnum]